MAIVAFDKHVLFSEEYVTKVFNTLSTLFREGPSKGVLKHAGDLYLLRQRYFVWFVDDIDQVLDKFESDLQKIGATAGYLEAKDAAASDRSKVVAKMYRSFAGLLGKEFMGTDKWDGESLSEEEAISRVIRRFRIVLGTEELTKIRSSLISKA